jgi:ABC-type multidrug transport system fused ATPase/permease subunit
LKFSLWPSLWRKAGDPVIHQHSVPKTLLGFVLKLSAGDQVWLCFLSVSLALLDTVPIEVQRRIINASVKQGDINSILLLAVAYAGLVIAQGLVKLLLNIYRSWVGENSVRSLRSVINELNHGEGSSPGSGITQGVEISIILSECEAVGGFVGDSISEPLLQVGIMVSVVGYLIFLQPLMVLVLVAVFLPQFVFVPLIQLKINKRARIRIATLRAASAEVVGEKAEGGDILGGQNQRFSRVFNLNMGIFKLKFSMNFLMNLTHQLGIALILSVGGWFVVTGRTEVGTVVAFVSGLSTVKDPWGDLVAWFQNMMVTSAKYDLISDAVGKNVDAKNLPPQEKSAEPQPA